MSDKPTAVPDWTPTGGDVVTPSAGEKSDGWQGGQRPPAQKVNWFWELLTQWTIWLADGLFTRNDTTDSSPVVGFTDASGNVRNWVDPNGLLMGEAVSMHYVWTSYSLAASQSYQLVTQDLYGSTDADCLIDHVVASSVMPDRMNSIGLRLTVEDLAVNSAVRLTRTDGSDISQFAYVDDLVCVMEFRMLLDTIGSNGVDVHMGFHQDPHLNTLGFADGTAEGFAMFEKLSADTNWYAANGNLSTDTRDDTGVPPVANNFQTFRVEYHGELTPVGVAAGSAVSRFYIDGVRVHEETGATVIAAGNLDFVIRARADGTGPSGDFSLILGPVRFAYSTHLSPNVPA